jgi:hypothetical protein
MVRCGVRVGTGRVNHYSSYSRGGQELVRYDTVPYRRTEVRTRGPISTRNDMILYVRYNMVRCGVRVGESELVSSYRISISYHIVSYHILISYRTISYHILISYLILSYPSIISYHILPGVLAPMGWIAMSAMSEPNHII